MRLLYKWAAALMAAGMMLSPASALAQDSAEETTPEALDVSYTTLPAQGTINPEINIYGVGAFDLNWGQLAVVNRQAAGLIELSRGTTMLAQVPAQNEHRIYGFAEFDKYIEPSKNFNINFFTGKDSPTQYPGDYTVVIPAGFFNFVEMNGEDAYTVVGTSKELVLHWTMPSPAVDVTITPASQSIVKSIKDVTIAFQSGAEIVSYSNDKKVSTSTDDETGEEIVTITYPIGITTPAGVMVPPEITFSGNQLFLSFPEELTEPGTYYLDINAGSVTYTSAGATKTNDMLYAVYRINEDIPFDPQITPVPGSYDKFSAFDTGVETAPKALFELKLNQPAEGIKWMRLMQRLYLAPVAADGSFVDNASASGAIQLDGKMYTDDEGNQTFYIYNMTDHDADVEPTAGQYVLVVPEKAFYANLSAIGKGMYYSPQTLFYYNINQTPSTEQCIITPEPGSTLSELKDITLTFTEGSEIVLGDNRLCYATLTKGLATYELYGTVKDNQVTFSVNHITIDIPGEWTFKTPDVYFCVNGSYPTFTADYTVEVIDDTLTTTTSPATGPIDLAVNTRGLASISLIGSQPLRCNREATGYIELYRDDVLLRQVPAQNHYDFYSYDGYTKYTEYGDIQVTFFQTANNPAMLPGNYKMVIPEGFLWVGTDKTKLVSSPEIVKEWVIREETTSSVYSINPPSGSKLANIQTITITLPEGATVEVDNTPTVTTTTDEDTGEEIEQVTYPISLYSNIKDYVPEISIEGNVVTLTYDPVITQSTHYYFDIKAGAITYTLPGAEPVSGPSFEGTYDVEEAGFTLPITPEPGTYYGLPAVPTYSEYVPNAIFDIQMPEASISAVTKFVYLYPLDEFGARDEDNAIQLASRLEFNLGEDGRKHLFLYNPSGAELGIDPPAGDYQLVLPGRWIYLYNRLDGSPAEYLPEMVYNYTFGPSTAELKYVISPEDESSVESIKDVTIIFTEAQNITLGTKVYGTLSNDYSTYILTPRVDSANPNKVVFTVDYTTLTQEGRWTFQGPKKGMIVDKTSPVITAVFNIGAPEQEDPTYTISPADQEEVESINKIRLGCSVRNVFKGDDYEAAITDGTDTWNLKVASITNGIITLETEEVITTAGTYTLSIKEGSFVAANIPSPAMTAVYTLVPVEVPAEPEYTVSVQGQATETEGVDVKTIEAVVVTCDMQPVAVSDNFSATIASGDRSFDLEITGNENGVITLAPQNEITFAGDWTVVIPAGAFVTEGVNSPRIEATFAVEGIPYVFTYTIDPAAGNVTALQQFTVTTNSDDLARTAAYSGNLSDGTTTVPVNVYEINGEVIVLRAAEEITAPGIWTLNVAEGSFTAEGEPTPAITATYTIAASGIDLLSADGRFTVFTAEGVCLVKDGGLDAVRALAPGMYIINNVKVVLR